MLHRTNFFAILQATLPGFTTIASHAVSTPFSINWRTIPCDMKLYDIVWILGHLVGHFH